MVSLPNLLSFRRVSDGNSDTLPEPPIVLPCGR